MSYLATKTVSIVEDDHMNFVLLKEYKSNEYFGEISVLTNLPNTYSAIAQDQTICGIVEKEHF
jgi:CRP-like cAMP-binding protein